MKTLVIGASGATGKHLVEQLLESGNMVTIIVRSTGNIPDHWNSDEKLTIIKRNITEINVEEMSGYIAGCQAVASCLGHILTLPISPVRSALFNPGKTSRINVGHFMAGLILNDDIWNKWKGQMPVIYNKTT